MSERRTPARQSEKSGPEAFLPARRVPLLYFAFAHACLFAGLATLAVRSVALGGFYYHPRLIAVVHLVTLGFITSSILGALYLVCPLALRLPLPEGRADLAACVSWMVAVSGLASHFWLEAYSGMAWAGTMALMTPLLVGTRVLAGLRRAPVPLEVRLPVALAIVNLFLAGGLGVILGINKHDPFLPFGQMAGVHAHLHLATVGFATLMVIGVGYRMLPMVLPAAMPRGRFAMASTVLIELGVLSLVAALFLDRAPIPAATAAIVSGLGLFFSQVVFMLRNRRPPPKERRRPDWSLLHAIQALFYLAVAGIQGLLIAIAPASDARLRLVMAYGVCGLLGFLCQIVIGIESRLLPLSAWLQAFAGHGYAQFPPSLHTAQSRLPAGAVLGLWTLGVPWLAFGLALDHPAWTSGGAGALALGVALTIASLAKGLARISAGARKPSPPRDPDRTRHLRS